MGLSCPGCSGERMSRRLLTLTDAPRQRRVLPVVHLPVLACQRRQHRRAVVVFAGATLR